MAKLAIVSITAANNSTVINFTPTSQQGPNSQLIDIATTVANPSLRETVSVNFRKGNSSKAVNDKTTVKVVIPYEVTLASGVTVLKYASRTDVLSIPLDCPAEIRTELQARAKVLDDVIITDCVNHGAAPY